MPMSGDWGYGQQRSAGAGAGATQPCMQSQHPLPTNKLVCLTVRVGSTSLHDTADFDSNAELRLASAPGCQVRPQFRQQHTAGATQPCMQSQHPLPTNKLICLTVRVGSTSLHDTADFDSNAELRLASAPGCQVRPQFRQQHTAGATQPCMQSQHPLPTNKLICLTVRVDLPSLDNTPDWNSNASYTSFSPPSCQFRPQFRQQHTAGATQPCMQSQHPLPTNKLICLTVRVDLPSLDNTPDWNSNGS